VHTSGLRVYGEEIFADRGVNAGGRRVTNVAAPIAGADAANKTYVDNAISAIEGEAQGAPGERGPRGFPGVDGSDGQSIVGPAGPAGTTSWGGLTDMPAWVSKFSFSDIGQFMDPAEQSNFDVVASDSLTPSANSTFNLGQDVRRWRFGFFQRVRLSGNVPNYEDEAIPYHFLRSYVAENARWFDLPGRPGWSNYFSLVTPTMLPIGSTSLKCGDIIPNGPNMFDLGTAATPWKHTYTVALTALVFKAEALVVETSATFVGIRLQQVGAPTADADAANKKYVDDTDTATRTYVDTREAATRTYANAKDTASRTYVDTKDAATRTLVGAVDTRLTDYSSTFKFTLAGALREPVLTVMTVQAAAISNSPSSGLISFTNISSTMYGPFNSAYEFGDPRIEVFILSPDKSIEIQCFIFVQSVDDGSVIGQKKYTYINTGIDVGFNTSPIMRILVTRTVRIDGENVRFRIGTHAYLHGAGQVQTIVV
jgi:hypothetical protein